MPVALKQGRTVKAGGYSIRVYHVLVEGKKVGRGSIKDRRHPSIALFMNKKSQGKGYGRQAMKMLAEHSGYDKVYGRIRKSNIASIKAAKHAGFKQRRTRSRYGVLMRWDRG